ncbi:uncharacterized protein PV09_04242 [Verruconis gallopava]|uniref:Uncharacterized protein n=1 Tax=Verruconis gallopava TaxID=253628 RepID=A0A0D2AC98_9PEZI|nr:uncharacterized protein PV09_04242 [Verruconis gallopava]KIW04483.1 hypothetical protein PV09_04242 [Verruconis gallopava]
MASCRAASEELDEELAIILTNSFLPLWNHNWFHGVSKPVQRIPQSANISTPSISLSKLTPLQKARRSFYWFLIKLTRGVGGEVCVATIPSPKNPDDELVAAVLLWCPPFKRNASSFGLQFIKDLWTLYKADMFAVLRGYGISGFRRITDVFEENVQRMFKESLAPLGFKPEECGFVQMIAVNTDPEFDAELKGKGFARQLLQWRIDHHWKECKNVKTGTGGKMTPVILDTTTEQGITAYKRLRFELVNQYIPNTGTDKNGYKLDKNLDPEEKRRLAEEAMENCVMSIMVKMPPETAAEAV